MMILSAEQLIASGWKKIEPNECSLCGYKPPRKEYTMRDDPRQLTMFEYWRNIGPKET